MRLVDLAKAVDVLPATLANLIGVTRQALYHQETKMTAKVRLAVLTLYDLNDERVKKEKDEAEAKWCAFNDAIADFVIKMNEGGDEDGREKNVCKDDN